MITRIDLARRYSTLSTELTKKGVSEKAAEARKLSERFNDEDIDRTLENLRETDAGRNVERGTSEMASTIRRIQKTETVISLAASAIELGHAIATVNIHKISEKAKNLVDIINTA
jgi:phage tail tape-measure protein